MAARHPDDPLALLVLGHAELHMGDRAAGEAAFTRLLEQQPDNVEALQFMAMARIEDAADLPDERTDLMNRARGYLATAYGADPGNYLTLLLIARSRDGAPGYPNDNDLATWEMAFIAAPQLSGIRLGAPAGTTRGFGEDEFRQIADLIVEVVDGLAANGEDGNGEVEATVKAKVAALCDAFPIYPNL